MNSQSRIHGIPCRTVSSRIHSRAHRGWAHLNRSSLLLIGLLLAGPLYAASPADNAGLSDAFAKLSHNSIANRSVTLAQLGLHETVLGGQAAGRREFYLPVPADVPLTGASLQMDAAYLHSDGGRVGVLLSLDGAPVLARDFPLLQGDASATLGVDGSPRPAGFLRLGLAWTSVLNDNLCADQTANGNLFRVASTTRFSYHFDSAAVTDLATAWSALPQTPVVMIPAGSLDAVAFDTAWRTQALVQRDGKLPLTQTLPAVGDTVVLDQPQVPAALMSFPAFAALAHAGPHQLANPAEVAALIALAPAAFSPDLLVVNAPLQSTINADVDALRSEILLTAPGAGASFDAWRTQFIQPLTTPLVAGGVRLAHLGAQAIVMVGDPRGISVLSQAWRPLDVSDHLLVHQLNPLVQADTHVVALSDLGGEPRTIDVSDQAGWEAQFDLSAASGGDRLPSAVVMDLAASPSPQNGAPIASVFFNDVLIGAKLLNTDGHAQQITAAIPRYALAARNTVRVVFQRQPDAIGCTTRGHAYPVAVLPTSHLTLAAAGSNDDDDFTGMIARYASHASLLVPAAYLDDARHSVPRIARLVDAAGMSPTLAVLTVVPGNTLATPDGPFLAADVAVTDEKARVSLAPDRMTINDAHDHVLFDVSGLSSVAVIDVVHAGGYAGEAYRTIGTPAPILPVAFQLSRGDIAVFEGSKVVKQIDTLHPNGIYSPDGTDSWRQILRWAIPAALIVAFVLLLLLAWRARRKTRNKA